MCVENSEVVVEIVLGVLRIQTEKFDQFFARCSSFWSTEVSQGQSGVEAGDQIGFVN